MDPLLNFTDKVVLITGAAQGFGLLLAQELAQRGAKLVLGDINYAQVQSAVKDLNEQGVQAIAVDCNVAKRDDCQAMVDSAVNTFGRVDIAVNNAGIAHDWTPFHHIEDDVIDQQFEVNVKGVQWGMRYQIKQMRTQGSGVILNVSSIAGLRGAPKLAAYCAAKHAVIGLTKSAAVDYGRENIRINAICPFFTLTKMVTEFSDQASRDMISKGTPMKRLGEPHEIVAMMLMMLSPANTYMTGQCIAVDGGLSAN